MSPDGQYAILGCADGGLHRFALQSQGHRGAFNDVTGVGAHGHEAPLCSISITEGQQVVSAATGEKELKLWRLGTQKLEGRVHIESKSKAAGA